MNLDRIRRSKRHRQIRKANGETRFVYSLAKELGKTVAELTQTLTREEMVNWAGFFALEAEEMDKERQSAQQGAATRTQTR